LLELFKEKANPTTKEVTYDEFIMSYGDKSKIDYI
jgi:trigger factor